MLPRLAGGRRGTALDTNHPSLSSIPPVACVHHARTDPHAHPRDPHWRNPLSHLNLLNHPPPRPEVATHSQLDEYAAQTAYTRPRARVASPAPRRPSVFPSLARFPLAILDTVPMSCIIASPTPIPRRLEHPPCRPPPNCPPFSARSR